MPERIKLPIIYPDQNPTCQMEVFPYNHSEELDGGLPSIVKQLYRISNKNPDPKGFCQRASRVLADYGLNPVQGLFLLDKPLPDGEFIGCIFEMHAWNRDSKGNIIDITAYNQLSAGLATPLPNEPLIINSNHPLAKRYLEVNFD